MIDNNTLIKITSRGRGIVEYVIPDLGNLHRSFQPGESKEITMDELKKLSWVPGGMYIIKNCLIVENQEALKEIMTGNVEPEYYYTREDVEELLLRGSLDQLLDCFDFAPQGVIDLIQDLAVKLEINDIAKRDAILKKTGFNVTKAIEVNKMSAEPDEDDGEEGKTRRAAPIEKAENEAPKRRAAAIPSKYNIVSIKK